MAKNFLSEDDIEQALLQKFQHLHGFDAPTVSTLYLDKPMKDHNLMQTIARANRVSSHKIKGHSGEFIEEKNGDIVDFSVQGKKWAAKLVG